MSRRRAVAAAATLITLSSLLWTTPPALAVTVSAAEVPCIEPTTRTVPPEWRELAEPPVTRADLEALPASETSKSAVARAVAGTLPSIVTIRTVVHVISGKHRRERPRMGLPKVRRMMNILNNGMAGGQNSDSAVARYRFSLGKITYTRRDSWYHAHFFGPRDKKMKRALHRGGPNTLNIYINGGGPSGQQALGWARFPWQYASTPRLDGVSVNHNGLPGGRARNFNLGDTVLHETGHWLGLFHTFQGGCGSQGDLVADTPAEETPSFACDTTSDSCLADPGLDPVRNFMDYSWDSCMNMFTEGQLRRADAAWAKWRQSG